MPRVCKCGTDTDRQVVFFLVGKTPSAHYSFFSPAGARRHPTSPAPKHQFLCRLPFSEAEKSNFLNHRMSFVLTVKFFHCTVSLLSLGIILMHALLGRTKELDDC